MLKKFRLAGLFAAALLLLAPAASFAREHEGHGGRGYSGGHAFSGRNFGGGYRAEHGGGRQYFGGRGFERRDHDWDRGYRGNYYGGGPSFNFGYGAPYYYSPYSYAPGACGYYDAYGYWHSSPGCYADPYSYGY
jgi:hypothetical protein